MAISKVIFNGDTLMDTTQKTVTAGSMLSGVTALKNDGTGITGSIASQVAQTIHPSTTDQTIASGKYLTGAQTVKGVLLTNLSAGNIKKDVVVKVGDSTDDDCVTSVTGTYEGASANIQPLSVGLNGTYTASGGVDGYSPVVVNVSGGGSTIKKQINFIDYDGTLLYSYTKAEIEAMTSQSDLPANPAHTGLTSQGWNWTLTQLKTQLTAIPDGEITVGQMYITTNGKTEIYTKFEDPERLSPSLGLAVSGTITVDWGDGTTADIITGSSVTTRKTQGHTYASTGSYTISITVSSGKFAFYSSTNGGTILNKGGSTSANTNRVYSKCIYEVHIGSGIEAFGSNAFTNCPHLKYVTIPNSVTSFGDYSFYYCYNLRNIIIPSAVTSIPSSTFGTCYSLSSVSLSGGLTSIGSSAFHYCFAIANITIPSTVTSIGSNAFVYCGNLERIIIPSGVTSIDSYAINYCYSLLNVTIPSGITSIGNYAFSSCYSLNSITIPSTVTSIGTSAFTNCYCLASITVPSNVGNIGNGAFSSCTGVKEYHILPTTVPTAGTTIFNSITSDCIIYVPAAKLSDYQGASNWSTYASYMQGE